MVEYLSEDKIAECKEIFDLFDKDNDGKIGVKDLEEIMNTLGSKVTYNIIKDYFLKLNKDNLSFVNFKDFLRFFVSFKDLDIADDIATGFEMYDMHSKGKTGLKELIKVLTSIGEPLTKEEIKEFFGVDVDDESSFNENTEITKEKFIELMLNKKENK